MTRLLKGAEVTAVLNQQLIRRAAALKQRGVAPLLALVRVGAHADDIAYEQGVLKRAESIGVETRRFLLPETVSQGELLAVIESVNRDTAVHGCLIFRPLPAQIDNDAARNALDPAKDSDGITDGSLAGVFTNSKQGFPPCTAQACLEILDHFGIELKGKRVTVIGRSLVVGKPLSLMLQARHATVTMCHSRTVDLPARCREAEILIAAAGQAEMVDASYLSPGQIVLDVGINFTAAGQLVGDVCFAAAENTVDAITPVPGGVGTVTTSVLIKHVIEAAEKNER